MVVVVVRMIPKTVQMNLLLSMCIDLAQHLSKNDDFFFSIDTYSSTVEEDKNMDVSKMNLESAIAETQSVLGPLFTKPSLTEKYLSRPPFRFIHDIVTSTLRETGFPANFFSAEELEPSTLDDKSKKVAFLEKLITLLNICIGYAIDVRASKIVAGVEPISTNALLTAFGKASVDSTLDRQLAIEYCLAGKSYAQVAIPRLKEQSRSSVEQRNVKEATCNTNSVSLEATPKGKLALSDNPTIIETNPKVITSVNDARNSPLHPAQLNELIVQCTGDLIQTRQMIEDITKKPRCLDKLLQRPPFSFLYDLIVAIARATNYGKHFMTEDSTDPSQDKMSKIAFLERVINHVQLSLKITVSVKPEQIVAGLEADKTRQFLQLLVLAATRSSLQNQAQQIYTCNPEVKIMIIDSVELTQPKGRLIAETVFNPSQSSGPVKSWQDNEEDSKQIILTIPQGEVTTISGATNRDARLSIDRLKELFTSGAGKIVETRQMIESIVSHPKASDMLLDRPPFRFLYDLIMSISSATGFGHQIFTEQEMDSRNITNKEEKIAFFDKIIRHVQTATGQEIEIRSAKIVSGLECEKTRLFLQLLVLAALAAGSKGRTLSESIAISTNGEEASFRKQFECTEGGAEPVIQATGQKNMRADEVKTTLRGSSDDQLFVKGKENTKTGNALRVMDHQENYHSPTNQKELLPVKGIEDHLKSSLDKIPFEFLTNSFRQRQGQKATSTMRVIASRPGPPPVNHASARLEEEETVFSSLDILKDTSVKINNLDDFVGDPPLPWHTDFADASQLKLSASRTPSLFLDEKHSALVKRVITNADLTPQTDIPGRPSSENKQEIRLRLSLPKGEFLTSPLPGDSSLDNLYMLMKAVQTLIRSIAPLSRCVSNVKENISQIARERDFWFSASRTHSTDLKVATDHVEQSAKDALETVNHEISNIVRNSEGIKVKIHQNECRIRELLLTLSSR